MQSRNLPEVGKIERVGVPVSDDALSSVVVQGNVPTEMGTARLSVDVVHFPSVLENPDAERYPPLIKTKDVLALAGIGIVGAAREQKLCPPDFRLARETRTGK